MSNVLLCFDELTKNEKRKASNILFKRMFKFFFQCDLFQFKLFLHWKYPRGTLDLNEVSQRLRTK